jgi:hypothetical protein
MGAVSDEFRRMGYAVLGRKLGLVRILIILLFACIWLFPAVLMLTYALSSSYDRSDMGFPWIALGVSLALSYWPWRFWRFTTRVAREFSAQQQLNTRKHFHDRIAE